MNHRTDDQQPAGEPEPQDPLRAINGIGPGYARVLHQLGIHQPADLLPHTAEQLAAMIKAAGSRVTVERIEADDWLGQARKANLTPPAHGSASEPPPLHGEGGPERELEEVKESPAAEKLPVDPPEGADDPEWRERGSFTIFFESQASPGVDLWRTRVYNERGTGPEEPFEGTDPTPWVNWMLPQVGLPVVEKLAAQTRPEPEAKAETKPEETAETKAEAKPEEAAEAKAEAKPEEKPEAKAETKQEEVAEAKTEAKPEEAAEAKAEAKPEEVAGTKAEEKPEEIAEAKPEEKPETKPEAKPEAEPSRAQAGLPGAPVPPAAEALPANAPLGAFDFELVDVNPWQQAPERVLEVEARFRLTGAGGQALAQSHTAYQVEFYLVDLESQATSPIGGEQVRLDPEQEAYQARQSFPIPRPGRYELQTIVLLPDRSKAAFRHGPTFKVVR